ncbi:MAG TPA: hypothetical protein DHW14_04855 [Clostridiales bacterium]|nr:hypothetical protein [Clostridiales bacterium]
MDSSVRKTWTAVGASVLAVALLASGIALGRGLPGDGALAAGGEDDVSGAGGSGGTISVTGRATVKAPPDTVSLTLGVEVQASEAGEASSRCASVMDRVVAALVSAGVPRDNIQTAHMHLWPQYDYSEGGKGHIIGYRASNQVRLSWSELDKVGELIDRAVEAGANTISGLSFSLADSEALYLEAVAEAVRDARAKAEALAAAAGVRVGAVKDMELHPDFGRTVDLYVSVREGYGADVPPPVEPGMVEIQVTVSVEYSIEQG